MSKSARRHQPRVRPGQRQPREQRPAQEDPWLQPHIDLQPQDRLSTYGDLRPLIPNYDEFVAEYGKEYLEDVMDHFFFYLARSPRLAAEPEFQDLDLGIDPYDFLVFEMQDILIEALNKGLINELRQPDGRFIPPLEHVVEHAIHRYLTPPLQRDIRRRCRSIISRLPDTALADMAKAVIDAIEDKGIPRPVISLLPRLFFSALGERVLELHERFEQDWENRDRQLDPWMEQIIAADFDRPADEAIEQLKKAGRAALPHLSHMYYDLDLTYDDYPVNAVVEIAAHIPCQLSLQMLLEAMFRDMDWASVRAAEALVGMPDLICPYFAYALTVPGGPDWVTALYGYEMIGQARCPGAFELIVEGLSYQGEQDDDSEGAQYSAACGLLALGDERAIPILHDYLRNPRADWSARRDLLHVLREESPQPWCDQIAGDLTEDTLPEEP